jgi:unsaturated chondroitin disaccharide hydrolase
MGLVIFIIESCTGRLNVDSQLKYCDKKVYLTLSELKCYSLDPRSIEKNMKSWNMVSMDDWTCGFWPGILWYDYEITRRQDLKVKADSFTLSLKPLAYRHADDHDLGFMIFCSFGNAYRLTGNPEYKSVLLATADSLATLFNPKVGTILSWPRMVKKNGWPHNTIIDNMMNLELLFWAAKNGNNSRLYDIANTHAETTMKNHFRKDYTAYHVVVYDTITGKKMKGVTHQGYSDSSMWARGQAWSIYGFTMCYRETNNPEYLTFAQKVADVYLNRLPSDYIPFWDFDDPAIPNVPKDASAAAITASALLELSTLIHDKNLSDKYLNAAQKMLSSLSSNSYLSGDKNQSFLLHSVGNMPIKGEVDASIIYADYYYLEALVRLKKINEGKNIYDNW